MIRRGFNNIRANIGRTVRPYIPAGIILLYHRIGDPGIDPFRLCVTPENFGQHLRLLRQLSHPMGLSNFVDAHRTGKVTRRSVVVTFDDGYADNLFEAVPMLERSSIPATVFITTGYIGKQREYWWDSLERIVLRPVRLPDTLLVNFDHTSRIWKLGAAGSYSEEEYVRDGTRRFDPSDRLKFYFSLWDALRTLSSETRQQKLNDIARWAEIDPGIRSTHRPLAAEEVLALGCGGMVEVGAHSVSHEMLSIQSVDFQRAEIEQGKAHLEELLGRTVTSFSYPYGDYSDSTRKLVRAAGMRCACTVDKGRVTRRTDPYILPRIGVENWTGEEFEKKLRSWLTGRFV